MVILTWRKCYEMMRTLVQYMESWVCGGHCLPLLLDVAPAKFYIPSASLAWIGTQRWISGGMPPGKSSLGSTRQWNPHLTTGHTYQSGHSPRNALRVASGLFHAWEFPWQLRNYSCLVPSDNLGDNPGDKIHIGQVWPSKIHALGANVSVTTAPYTKLPGCLQGTHKSLCTQESETVWRPHWACIIHSWAFQSRLIHQSRVIFNVSNVAWQHNRHSTFIWFLGLIETVNLRSNLFLREGKRVC